MAELIDQALAGVMDTLDYEIEGIRRRWKRRITLFNNVKKRVENRVKQIRQKINADVITEQGKIHYTEEELIMSKGGIHY